MVLLVMMSMPGLDAAAAAAATWKLAMVSLLLLKAACIIPNQCKHTHQLKRKKGEAKLIEITGRNQKTWPGIFKQQEISQKSLGIFPPHFRFAFFMKKLWRPEQRREKRKARTKEARERFGAKFLPAAGAGSNWVDQDRQEPKKRPWYRIDFF